MADKKERIMDLLRRGVITEEEAIELLEKSGESLDEVQSDKFSYKDKNGFVSHDIDAGDAIKEAISGIMGNLKAGARALHKSVDDNVDFGNGWPRMRQTTQGFEKDLEGTFHSVRVDVPAAKVAIKKGDKAYAEGKYTIYGAVEGNKEDFIAAHVTFEVQEDTLVIESDVKRIGMDFELTLPEREYEKLTVDTISGKLLLTELSADEVKIKLIHGETKLSALTAKRLSVEAKNGNLSVLNTTTDALKLQLVNGNLKFEGSFEEGDVSLVNGNILLTQQDARARKLSASNVHGDIKLSVPERLGLVGHVRALFGGYKTRLKLDQTFEPGKNGAALVRTAEEALTFELETKTGTIWLKDADGEG